MITTLITTSDYHTDYQIDIWGGAKLGFMQRVSQHMHGGPCFLRRCCVVARRVHGLTTVTLFIAFDSTAASCDLVCVCAFTASITDESRGERESESLLRARKLAGRESERGKGHGTGRGRASSGEKQCPRRCSNECTHKMNQLAVSSASNKRR